MPAATGKLLTDTFPTSGCTGTATQAVNAYVCLNAGGGVFNRYQVEGSGSPAIKKYTFANQADCDAGIPHTLSAPAATYTAGTCELTLTKMAIAAELAAQTTWKMATQEYTDCGATPAVATILYTMDMLCLRTTATVVTYTRYQPVDSSTVKFDSIYILASSSTHPLSGPGLSSHSLTAMPVSVSPAAPLISP